MHTHEVHFVYPYIYVRISTRIQNVRANNVNHPISVSLHPVWCGGFHKKSIQLLAISPSSTALPPPPLLTALPPSYPNACKHTYKQTHTQNHIYIRMQQFHDWRAFQNEERKSCSQIKWIILQASRNIPYIHGVRERLHRIRTFK